MNLTVSEMLNELIDIPIFTVFGSNSQNRKEEIGYPFINESKRAMI